MPSEADLRQWIGFIAMCVGMFMAILDIQIVASSLPDIAGALDIADDQLSWVQTAYLIAEVIAIPLTGWLTRFLSLRGMFVGAVLGFTLASAFCAVSGSFAPLVTARILQGFCGGAIIPAVFTAVFRLFPPAAHARATVIAGVFAVLAPTLGPMVGGYITETYSWHWLFLINVAPGIAVAAVALALLPREGVEWILLRELDTWGLALLATALGTLEVFLKEGPTRGWDDWVVLTLGACSLGAGVLFVRRSLIEPRPLVALRRFGDRCFWTAAIYSFVLGAGLYGSVYLLPLFLGFIRDHSPFEIGTIMLVCGAAQLATAPVAAVLERRFDRCLLTLLGFALFGAGLVANGFSTKDTDFDGLILPQLLRGAGVMLCILPTTSLALERQLPEHLADASGLFNLMRNLGGAIGIALVDTVLRMRPQVHIQHLVQRLMAGDPATAAYVGLSTERFTNTPFAEIDEQTKEFVRPLVERAAAVLSFDDAWFLLGGLFAASLLLLPLLRETRREAAPAAFAVDPEAPRGAS